MRKINRITAQDKAREQGVSFVVGVDVGVRGSVGVHEQHSWSRSRENVHGREAARKQRDNGRRLARSLKYAA
jgi:hypothetical protein